MSNIQPKTLYFHIGVNKQMSRIHVPPPMLQSRDQERMKSGWIASQKLVKALQIRWCAIKSAAAMCKYLSGLRYQAEWLSAKERCLL